jgi:hypothetical protein
MTDFPSGPAPDDELDAELARTDDVLGRSLAQLLTAPAALEARTRSQVTTSLMSRSLLGTGADLLTVGWLTARFLFSQPETDQNDDEEVTP